MIAFWLLFVGCYTTGDKLPPLTGKTPFPNIDDCQKNGENKTKEGKNSK